MRMRWRNLVALTLCGAAAVLQAQINLPAVPLPLPLPAPTTVLRGLGSEVPQAVVSSVRARTRELLRRYPGGVERDPRGAPVVRAVILALSPDPAALQQALVQGYVIQRDETLDGVGERVITLLVPRGIDTQRALQQLRVADPAGQYDFDHLFVESASAPDEPTPPTNSSAASIGGANTRIGLIDGGVDTQHPVFAAQRVQQSGCDGHSTASVHGTAVASLLIGSAGQFHGAAPGAGLMAVDVYCAGTEPGGRVRDIVSALAALAGAKVRVINMSVVGPDNTVLAAVVRKVLAQSVLIVAAAGNDGPNARPLYPAAYPGVIAVTAVDASEHLLLEACGGDHLSFAAPGADMLAASPGGKFAAVRGTSFAAPLVAGLLADLVAHDDGTTPQQAVQRLASVAMDRGKTGRDRRYGYGLVGMQLRVDPAKVAGRLAVK